MTPHTTVAPGKDLTLEQFFRAFVAALKLRGVEFVDTRGDAHHKRFHLVVNELRKAQGEGRAEALEMPRALVPNPFTDRYHEFDDALIRLQRGLLGSHNPFYPGITLTLTDNRARKIIGRLSTPQSKLIRRLAEIYGNGPSAAGSTGDTTEA